MAIDTRLLAAMLPIAAATISRRRETVAPGHDFWEQVHAVAPAAVWAYVVQVDAECAAATSAHDAYRFDADAWLKQRHPAFDDVLEGLARAVQKYGRYPGSDRDSETLTFTQGYTIQWAECRLGGVYATERPGAGVTTSVVYDRQVQERAAFDLLGWTVSESYRQWSDPCAFLEQWRSGPTRWTSADMLAKAGLFDAELALLAAEGER